MELHEQATLLNQAWLLAQELIRVHGKDTVIGVDAARLQTSIEHIEQHLGLELS